MQVETVTLLEVIAAAQANRASLVPESAGYVMLGLGRAMAGVPMRLNPERVVLTSEGGVAIEGPKQATRPEKACATLRKLLTGLLDLAHGSAPALRQLAGGPGSSSVAGRDETVETFFAAVAKALIPINRAAAKRAMARLARETLRAKADGALGPVSWHGDDDGRASVEGPASMPEAQAAPIRITRASVAPHSASLTPTFVDATLGEQHERSHSGADEVKRVVLEQAATVDKARVAGAANTSPAAAVEPERPVEPPLAASRAKTGSGKKSTAPSYSAASVETLLDRFASSADADASLKAAAVSLGQLSDFDRTPQPPDALASRASEEKARQSEPVATPRASVDIELSPAIGSSRASSTPSGQAVDEHISSLPPLLVERRPRAERKLWASAALLAVGLASVAVVAITHPELLKRRSPVVAAPKLCVAELTLKNLPAPHELLVRLGTGSFTTRPLPTGVRLELVAIAPDHLPRRIIVEHDASWHEGAVRALDLDVTLEAGVMTEWPKAAAGEVGGSGRAGVIQVRSSVPAIELWLVASAGDGSAAKVPLPCDETAHFLAVNPSQPTQSKRLSVEPELLAAAARTGQGELTMMP